MSAFFRGLTRVSLAMTTGAIALSAAAATPAPPPPRPSPPVFVLDALDGKVTPLAKAYGKKVDDKLIGGGRETLSGRPCSELAGHGNRPEGKGGDAKKCGVPGVHHTKGEPVDTFDESTGRKTGRKVVNTLKLHYDTPDQRGLAEWPDLKIDMARTAQPGGVEKSTLDDVRDVVGVNFNASQYRPPGKPLVQEGLTCDILTDVADDNGKATCDLGKQFVKKANALALKKNKGPAFWANEDGSCKEGDPKEGIKCGSERRVQNVTETFEAKCPENFEYAGGHCVKQTSTTARAFAKVLGDDGVEEPAGTVDGGVAMMGFTFAPPKVGWHIEYSEEACIDLIFDDFCFTIFSAWVGYDIDIAAGLRLPVDVTLETLPDPEDITRKAIAGRPLRVRPSLSPADFSVGDYVDFCMMQDNPPGSFVDGRTIASCDRFAFPEYFSRVLADGLGGTASGAKTNAAGYATGATTITLSASGKGSIEAGDSILFEGDSYKYSVVTGDSDVLNGGQIVIAAPGLRRPIEAAATPIIIANAVFGGTASGAMTDTVAHAKDLSWIRLSPAGSGSIRRGDQIKFAGDSTNYVVKTGDGDVSDGGTIEIDPGLNTALAAATPLSVRNEIVVDGKELVAQAGIKVGAFVELFGIPVVNLGIDAGADFATLCTLYKLYQNGTGIVGELADFGTDFQNSLNLLALMKEQGINCASFETPFGAEKDDDTGQWTLPTFPFLGEHTVFELPADCEGADTVDIGGKSLPLCTGLRVKYGPASFGLGLEVNVSAVSGKIEGTWQPRGDARTVGFTCPAGGCPNADKQSIEWLAPLGDIVQPEKTVLYDNFERGATGGRIRINDLRYCLNKLQIVVNAKLMFGGLLEFLPDLASVPIFSMVFGAPGCGIPIPQHNRTRGLDLDLAVANFALEFAGDTAVTNLVPGQVRNVPATLRNLGTERGSFTNFVRLLPDDLTDLPKGWVTSPSVQELAEKIVTLEAGGETSIDLSVAPLADPFTRVGNYVIQIYADSVEAKSLGMAAADPLGQSRHGRPSDARVAKLAIYVEGFREPRIEIQPSSASGKPGAPARTYQVEVKNWGNEDDAMKLAKELLDSNSASCTLRTLGSSTGCPYRGYPTVAPSSWTTVAGIPQRLPIDTTKYLQPAGKDLTSFAFGVPADWAGMRDTTYLVELTATSTTDKNIPAAFKKAQLAYTVVATKQSMTRYVGLELEELARQIEAANAAGTSTGGALPIITNDVQRMNARALDSILAGNLGNASNSLAAEIRGMEAFLKAIQKVPQPFLDDWTLRANAIIQDMRDAQASNVSS